MKLNFSASALLCLILFACDTVDHVANFEEYYTKVQAQDITQWSYTSDTLLQWFEDKNGVPVKRYSGKVKSGLWKEWDQQMKSRSYYDSLWFNEKEYAVQGFFYETNDFYELIGKGPTKTLRTYWFDSNDKICEMLIYWIPEENTHTSEHLAGFYEWALVEDSVALERIYPNQKIVPSKENAILWKDMLTKWNRTKMGDD